jgi:peroxiredoxin
VQIRPLALALLLALTVACGADTEGGKQTTAPAGDAQAAPKAGSESGHEGHDHARSRGRPMPAFSGWSLDGKQVNVGDLLGRRLVLFFFNPEVKEAVPAADAMVAISPLRGENNFEILGIATGSNKQTAKDFVAAHRMAFTVIDDSDAAITRRLNLRSPVAVVGVDAEGYMIFGTAGFGGADEAGVEANLRKALRLPSVGDAGERFPKAPHFTAPIMGSDERFDLADQAGKPMVLIFFLHTCPHCHAALTYLKKALAELPEDKRPPLFGLEITGRTYEVREELKRKKLDFFPVLFDDGGIQDAYKVFAGVPDIFLIDAQGRIRARTQGWNGARDESLLKMQLAKLVGAPIPMMLVRDGYSGNEVCGVCHETEFETWQFTTHASAFDTLVKHGADQNPECVGCHVVGWNEKGGFTSSAETPHLEDVGCETCHGRGGPHQSPDLVQNGNYEPVCVTCHDTTHSLGFDYATFRPRISHKENLGLLTLPADEKARILAERGRPGGGLLPTGADYVGSDACQSCHPAEYETWSASPHGHPIASLRKQGREDDSDCLACHTTAFGKPGGFPTDGTPDAHPDLARVGCESCHGPGGNHVGEDAARIGTIVSLGDKCDSCVILQICGTCHDDANDPGFKFEVEKRIEAQRHGTIEPGTGKPKADSAFRPADDADLLAEAFRHLDGRS